MAEQAAGAPLIESFDAVLFDLDGVIYAGPHAIPGAVEAVARLQRDGVHFGYVTNNASRTPAQVALHLSELGAPATAEQVVSSSQAGAKLLADRYIKGTKVLIAGSKALAQEVENVGLVPVWGADDGASVVIQGFDPEIGWKQLAEATFAINAGAAWVATNTDMTIPQSRGIAPGNGALVAVVAAATGRQPDVAGKPEAPLFHAAAQRLGAQKPLVVGDRLDTDIRGGNTAGMATAVVLTGVDTRETVLAAVSAERPDYVLDGLDELFVRYPAPTPDGGGYRCGQSYAVVRNRELSIRGDETATDSWRAACAAWWAAFPDCTTAALPRIRWEFAG